MAKMWIEIMAICASITIALSIGDHRPKPKSIKHDDHDRSVRGLEYSLGNSGFVQIPRLERRISTLPISTQAQYPPFFPSATNQLRKYASRPYVVSMEPLINYSSRDPLYDTSAVHLLPQPHNDLVGNKHDDLLADHNHLADNVYRPPIKQYIERPVYIKEPEPIIEIIIKEANTTQQQYGTTQPILVPKRKKEEVQVFYVKYKKNPHGTGKDSVIYDRPIAAISPIKDGHRTDDDEDESGYELHHPSETAEAVTYTPPITTTIRAIIKPDSETYHADHGIHVTFNSEHTDHEVGHSSRSEHLVVHSGRSTASADINEQSAPHPSVHQEREFVLDQNPFEKRLVHFRQPQPYRPFINPPAGYQQDFSQQFQPSVKRLPPPQINAQFQFQSGPFAEPPRQPVPYQPFEQIRNNLPAPFQFAKQQTHFPVTHPQVPSVNPPVVFNPQRENRVGGFSQNFNDAKGPFQSQSFQRATVQPIIGVQNQFVRGQNLQLQQQQQLNENYQYFRQPTEVQQSNFNHVPLTQHINHNYQNGNVQIQQQHFPNVQQNVLPAGGELIHSLPKFEQHISIPPAPIHLQKDINYNQNIPQQHTYTNLQHQQQNLNNQASLNPEQHNKQILNHQFRPLVNHDQALKQLQTQINFSSNLNNFKVVKATTTVSPPILQNTYKTLPPFTRNYFTQLTTQFPTPKRTYNTLSSTTTTTTTTAKPESTTTDLKALNIQLPDEVPEDLRQQLLSSGILKNADISILDYDKIGDIPLSALPPDQLANFYNAGGGQQLSSASRVQEQIVKPDGSLLTKAELEVSSLNEAVHQPTLKVVHYNPSLDLKSSYLKDGATQVEPVVLNDHSYNRYLPLKVSGTQFPIPDVPQLKGKNINSVVVLAPIDYNFQDNQRRSREAKKGHLKLLKNESLKKLLKHPTKANYNDWLRKENSTSSEQQSVILLVTGQKINREIFMYDVSTQSVSKLNGDLSSAFVNAAESNTADEERRDFLESSNRVETRVPIPPHMSRVTKRDDDVLVDDLTPAGSEYVDVKIPIIDPLDDDLEADGSEQWDRFVDSGGEELTVAATNRQHVNV